MSIRTFGERIRAVFRGIAREGRLPDGTTPSRRATIERDGAFRHPKLGLRYPIESQTKLSDISTEEV